MMSKIVRINNIYAPRLTVGRFSRSQLCRVASGLSPWPVIGEETPNSKHPTARETRSTKPPSAVLRGLRLSNGQPRIWRFVLMG